MFTHLVIKMFTHQNVLTPRHQNVLPSDAGDCNALHCHCHPAQDQEVALSEPYIWFLLRSWQQNILILVITGQNKHINSYYSLKFKKKLLGLAKKRTVSQSSLEANPLSSSWSKPSPETLTFKTYLWWFWFFWSETFDFNLKSTIWILLDTNDTNRKTLSESENCRQSLKPRLDKIFLSL